MGILYNQKSVPPAWEASFVPWLASMRTRGLREETVKTRERHMSHFARCHPSVDPLTLTIEIVLDWAAEQTWKPETRHSYYQTFKSFLIWLEKLRGTGLHVELPQVRRPRPGSRAVPEHLVSPLIRHADDRVALGSHIASSAGLRRDELSRCHLEAIVEMETGRTFEVEGKGGDVRYVPISDGLDLAIRLYVKRRRITGWLFPGDVDGHIGATWLGKLINRELPRPYSLHGLRHRFASRIYAATKDILLVKELLGHASVATTQIYIETLDATKRAAVNRADASHLIRSYAA